MSTGKKSEHKSLLKMKIEHFQQGESVVLQAGTPVNTMGGLVCLGKPDCYPADRLRNHVFQYG